MRGHTGAGASPSRLALAATKIGILLETPVESPEGEVWDFSEYKSYYRLGMKHGRKGFPQWIFDLNREHGPKQVAEINTPEELLTALWNGCGVGVGSMIGVSKEWRQGWGVVCLATAREMAARHGDRRLR